MQNDLAMYNDLADQWWDPRGHFISLSWIAKSRAALIPPADREGAVLVDVACGGGLLHPHIEGKGYLHVGVDLAERGLAAARAHGLDIPVRADIGRLPLADDCADVVVAGQCLEHVQDPYAVAVECCRVLRPGGLLVLDTIADTTLARLLIIGLGEHLPFPGMAPKGCHDHRLFVNRQRLAAACAGAGVALELRGLFPSVTDFLWWFAHRRPEVRMRPVGSTAVLYQAWGRKRAAPPPAEEAP